MKILIVRNDKLGDFILSYPVYTLLKSIMTECEIHVLVPDYTASMANSYPWIDKVIIDPGSDAAFSQQIHLLKTLRKQKYDSIITLFSTTRIAILSLLAGIKYRLAPATKIAQILYNHRLTQRRSRSLKPEFEYNLDLAKQFLSDHGFTSIKLPQPPLLQYPENEIAKIHEQFYEEYKLNADTKLIFIHPGTGGSATNLNLQQYADLAKNINYNNTYTFVITAGPSEIEYANNLSQLLEGVPHIVYLSTEGLVHFAKIIQLCDLFISASTGPLHIAGALNRPTAAFYQRRRSATPLRWQTLNSEERRLAFTPPENEHESDLQKIDIIKVANKINTKFLKN
ncbi:MAG: glycosyltransferase family 9 protein [Gammaproteobacteria bacterium]|nr:glycosyltransferase family 9 protein [Gammaproteobacteria bacterium]